MKPERYARTALTSPWAWMLPAVCGALALVVVATDAQLALFHWLNDLPLRTGDAPWANLTVLGDGAYGCAFALLLLGRRPRLLWAMLIATLLGFLLLHALKQLSEVPRPLRVLTAAEVHVIGPARRSNSFPSGHTTTVFTLAALAVQAFRGRAARALSVSTAVLVGISRIVVGAHWPLDVLAGAGLGWLLGLAAMRLAQRWSWGVGRAGQLTLGVLLTLGAIDLFVDDSGFDPHLIMRWLGCTLALVGGMIGWKRLLDAAGTNRPADPIETPSAPESPRMTGPSCRPRASRDSVSSASVRRSSKIGALRLADEQGRRALFRERSHNVSTHLGAERVDGRRVRADLVAPALDPESARSEAAVAEGRSRPMAAWLARCTLRLGALLPLWGLQLIGHSLGYCASVLPTRSRNRSRTNIGICLPHLPERDRNRLARRSLCSLGSMALELPAFWGWKRARVLRLIREVEGLQHLDAAVARGRGVLVAMPHLGAWELAGLYCAARHPITGLYRPSRLREMDEVFCAGRGRFGAKLVPAGHAGVRKLLLGLRAGELSFVLPDIDPKSGDAVFAPMFGHPAKTSTLVPRLAQASGAGLLMCFVERLGIGRGFRIHFTPTDPEILSRDLLAATTAMNLDIERVIRSAPEQYLWRYRRFRHRPHGHPSPY